MRILWMSGKVLSDTDDGSTGTWLEAMAQRLYETGQVELVNVTEGRVKKSIRQDYGSIQQWIVPAGSRSRQDGSLLPISIVSTNDVIQNLSPDLIHVWGSESNGGLITSRNPMEYPVLLEIQGIRGMVARVFHGGLTLREQLACIGLKELFLRSSIFQERKRFESWGVYDREIISGHRFISCHSSWSVAQVKSINKKAKIFRVERLLRRPFYEHSPWKYTGDPVIFCSAAYHSPFKGLHIAVRSLAVLRDHFPGIQMRIAGLHQKAGFRQDGYMVWLTKEIKRLNLESNITWLGPLTGSEIARELTNCSALVLPTFVESYCVALVEAMILGVPTVVSFNGGTAYLASDNDTALFFPPGDEAMCAYQIERLLIDQPLAHKISTRARELAIVRNDPVKIVQNQLKIYQSVITEAGVSE